MSLYTNGVTFVKSLVIQLLNAIVLGNSTITLIFEFLTIGELDVLYSTCNYFFYFIGANLTKYFTRLPSISGVYRTEIVAVYRNQNFAHDI